jgi:hypothetical protein
VVSFAWRDDSLREAEAEDGEEYPGPNTLDQVSDYAFARGASVLGPTINVAFANRVSLLTNELSSAVSYEPPEWTGLLPTPGIGGVNESWVEGSLRFAGTFVQSQQLADFPFDQQVRRRGSGREE